MTEHMPLSIRLESLFLPGFHTILSALNYGFSQIDNFFYISSNDAVKYIEFRKMLVRFSSREHVRVKKEIQNIGTKRS